jgi:hypothetical protein
MVIKILKYNYLVFQIIKRLQSKGIRIYKTVKVHFFMFVAYVLQLYFVFFMFVAYVLQLYFVFLVFVFLDFHLFLLLLFFLFFFGDFEVYHSNGSCCDKLLTINCL